MDQKSKDEVFSTMTRLGETIDKFEAENATLRALLRELDQRVWHGGDYDDDIELRARIDAALDKPESEEKDGSEK